MAGHRIFVMGDTLLAESIRQLLIDQACADSVEVVGTAPTLEAARSGIETTDPDIVVVAGQDMALIFGVLLASYPDLSIIYADFDKDHLQVVSSRRTGRHHTDLFAAIASLPVTSVDADGAQRK